VAVVSSRSGLPVFASFIFQRKVELTEVGQIEVVNRLT
jgi:hypothetical protein